MIPAFSTVSVLQKDYSSTFLERDVALTILLPAWHSYSTTYPLLLFNDGQDFDALGMTETLSGLYAKDVISPSIVVGIHANHDRIYEYGTAGQADYAGRGNKAAATAQFVVRELIPFLHDQLGADNRNVVYTGFSLGGLMALDVVWNNPGVFAAAGVFSGSLWWRQKALGEGYHDSDRIMHAQIRHSSIRPDLKFWFQCGGRDEYDDRDNDGVIDSIQDTLECIAELEYKGFKWNEDVFYKEIPEGTHDQATWRHVLPEYLTWAARHILPSLQS